MSKFSTLRNFKVSQFSVFVLVFVFGSMLFSNDASAQVVKQVSVTNSASFSQASASPLRHMNVAIFGSGLNSGTASSSTPQTTLGGKQLLVRDCWGTNFTGRMTYISPSQINAYFDFYSTFGKHPTIPNTFCHKSSGGANIDSFYVIALKNVSSGVEEWNSQNITYNGSSSSFRFGFYTATANGLGFVSGYYIRVLSDGSQVQEPIGQIVNGVWTPITMNYNAVVNGKTTSQVYLVAYATGLPIPLSGYNQNLRFTTPGGSVFNSQTSYFGSSPYSGTSQINVLIPKNPAMIGDVTVSESNTDNQPKIRLAY